jgi:hypothetical protein
MMSDEVTPTEDGGATEVDNDPEARAPDFSDLNDSRLRASHEKLQKSFDALKAKPTTSDTLAEARSIRTQQAQIAAEMRKRADDARALQDEMTAIDGEDVGLPEVEATNPDEEQEDEGATVTTIGDAPAAPASQAPAAVAANAAPSATAVAANRDGQSKGSKLASVPARAKAPWVAAAAANDGSIQFGSEISLESLGDQIMRLQKSRGRHKTVMASLPAFTSADGELLSDQNGPLRNDALIREAVLASEIRSGLREANPAAMTAAICDPLDIIREIPNPGRSKETPFASSLPFRGAGRLGFQFTRAMQLSTMSGATSIWTDADQEAIDATDEATWKAVVCVDCGTPVETTAEELTWGLCYEESTDISAPERVADALDVVMTLEKRVREGYLLRRFDQLSSAADWDAPSIGAIPDLIEILTRRIFAAAYAERLELPGATVWLPPGLIEALTVDRVRKQTGAAHDRAASALAEVRDGLPEGVNVVVLRDISDNLHGDADITHESVNWGNDALAAPGAAVTALSHDECGLFRIRWGWPSAFIAYSTGMTNFGVLRDASLIRQNKAIQFGREWLGLDKHGSQASGYVNTVLSLSGIRGANLITTASDTLVCGADSGS